MKKSVTLNPGESKAVTFSFTPTIDGVYSVSVDGLSGSFIAHPLLEAEFEVSNLLIDPTEVYVGEPVSISVVVTNVGGMAGETIIECEVS